MQLVASGMQPVASNIKKSGPLHDATTIPTTTRGNCVVNPTAAEDRAAWTFAFNWHALERKIAFGVRRFRTCEVCNKNLGRLTP